MPCPPVNKYYVENFENLMVTMKLFVDHHVDSIKASRQAVGSSQKALKGEVVQLRRNNFELQEHRSVLQVPSFKLQVYIKVGIKE